MVGGDGDGFSIGGNHFIHACRRNLDLTYIVMDNQVYGMTKGQASPTTPPNWSGSRLTPHGTGLPGFNPAAIALAAGAGLIARGFSGDPGGLTELLVQGIEYPGFAFIHVLSPCVTYHPEQRAWKQTVHEQTGATTADPLLAAQRLQQGDQLATGMCSGRHPLPDPPHRLAEGRSPPTSWRLGFLSRIKIDSDPVKYCRRRYA